MAMLLTMPTRNQEATPSAVPKYRRRTRVIHGRVWEIVERVEDPWGDSPKPANQRIARSKGACTRAVA